MANSSAESRLPRKLYDAAVARLREKLVSLQVALKASPVKILLIFEGFEGAGRGELINTLSSWLDPRGFETLAFREPSDEERERPLMWRYWRSLPPYGRFGIYANSWYVDVLRIDLGRQTDPIKFSHEIERIRHFEKLQSDDGTLLIKVWLDLSKAAQSRRLRSLESDEHTAWRVTPEHWRQNRMYTQFAELAARVRQETSRLGAFWTVINSEEERSRNLSVGELIVTRVQEHLLKRAKNHKPVADPRRTLPLRPSGLRRLASLPLDQVLSVSEYEGKREKWLGRLNQAVRAAAAAKRSIIFVFEGWDAAGKGGVIRRVSSAIDARDYRVIPVSKPTDEEKAHHYLWRFWRHVPRAGMITIYDRSWYGRVLVERLEGFARPEEWRRAFSEINDFEQQIVEHGTIIIKFWLHIGKAEQLRRFRERESTPYKQHKINEEDWRNRRKWAAYEVAVGDMLALTDNSFAPWQLIPANNKRYARLQVLKTACKQIEEALGGI